MSGRKARIAVAARLTRTTPNLKAKDGARPSHSLIIAIHLKIIIPIEPFSVIIA
jgi:bifunctional DNase/RNase